MKNINNKKGFTLIEVVLVLAIGGLIFLLAFVAFQQVSRNRRDTQRRSDVARVIAELQNYRSDTGSYPNPSTMKSSTFCGNPLPSAPEHQTFAIQYLAKGCMDFKDPNGNTYDIAATDAQFSGTVPYTVLGSMWPIRYGYNQKCDTNGNFTGEQGSIALRMRLETGVACRDVK